MVAAIFPHEHAGHPAVPRRVDARHAEWERRCHRVSELFIRWGSLFLFELFAFSSKASCNWSGVPCVYWCSHQSTNGPLGSTTSSPTSYNHLGSCNLSWALMGQHGPVCIGVDVLVCFICPAPRQCSRYLYTQYMWWRRCEGLPWLRIWDCTPKIRLWDLYKSRVCSQEGHMRHDPVFIRSDSTNGCGWISYLKRL